MNNRKTEFLAGLFVRIGLLAVIYLTVSIGSARFFQRDTYEVHTQFNSSAGVTVGSRVEIPGVRVGTVNGIELRDDFYSRITLEIPDHIELDEDTIASIKTADQPICDGGN